MAPPDCPSGRPIDHRLIHTRGRSGLEIRAWLEAV